MGKQAKIRLKAMIGSGNRWQRKVRTTLAKNKYNRDSDVKERRHKPDGAVLDIFVT